MIFKPRKSIEVDKLKLLQEKKSAMVEGERFRKVKHDKIDNYAKYVREMYWPSVSVKK